MISASQINTHNLCPRLYAGGYLCGWPRDQSPPTEAQALGKGVHKQAELYFSEGKAPDDTRAGNLFTLALPWLPPPRTAGMRAEGESTLSLSGVDYILVLDLQYTDSDGTPVVLDFKTTANLKKAFLGTKEAALQNPQVLIYAVKALVQTKAPQVRIRWVYIKTTRKYKCEVADYTLTKAEVEEAFGRLVHPKARHLTQLKTKRANGGPEAEKLFFSFDPNWDACYTYGPCKYLAKCKAGLQESDMSDDLLAELEAATMAGKKGKGVNPEPLKTQEGQVRPTPDSAARERASSVSDAELGAAVRKLMQAWQEK